MMKVILYTTHCPRCEVLKTKLEQKNISYKEETDIEKMLQMGIKSVPMLSIDGASVMNFIDAIKWVNEQGD